MIKSHLKYLKYVLRHKMFVMLECAKLGIPWQGVVHDLSKFSRHEWTDYVFKFFGPELADNVDGYYKKKARDERFGVAWLHHQHNNPHHWQYFVQIKEPFYVDGSTESFNAVKYEVFPMPEWYVREMLADWRAMAHSFGDDSIYVWYKTNKPRMILHPETEKYLESLMDQEELYAEEDLL